MIHTANRSAPEPGKLRRALSVVFAWLQAMEYSGFDYTLDRINGLESELARLKEELRELRAAPASKPKHPGNIRSGAARKL